MAVSKSSGKRNGLLNSSGGNVGSEAPWYPESCTRGWLNSCGGDIGLDNSVGSLTDSCNRTGCWGWVRRPWPTPAENVAGRVGITKISSLIGLDLDGNSEENKSFFRFARSVIMLKLQQTEYIIRFRMSKMLIIMFEFELSGTNWVRLQDDLELNIALSGSGTQLFRNYDDGKGCQKYPKFVTERNNWAGVTHQKIKYIQVYMYTWIHTSFSW